MTTQPTDTKAAMVERAMEQAQVFASTWSLVGGQFDSGQMIEDAKEAKEELRTYLESIIPEKGEAVAWMHPDYAPGVYLGPLSPVTVYQVNGWTPLYASPPPAASPAEQQARDWVAQARAIASDYSDPEVKARMLAHLDGVATVPAASPVAAPHHTAGDAREKMLREGVGQAAMSAEEANRAFAGPVAASGFDRTASHNEGSYVCTSDGAVAASEPKAWLRKDGMKAMPDEEKVAWQHAGQPEIVEDYTIPLYLGAAPAGVLREALEALTELRYASTDKAEAMADAAIASLRSHLAGSSQGVEMLTDVYEQRLREVLAVVSQYLPPDGISVDEAMSKIIGLVDPWPQGEK